MINKLLDRITVALDSMKDSKVYRGYDKINSVFTTPVKCAIGFVIILCTVIAYILLGFSYSYDALIASLFVLGVFNLVNAVFSAIYRIRISYIPFMIFNAAGFLMYMFVISKYELLGTLFTILFAVLVFVMMWICDMCLLYGAGPRRRILGGLIVNFVMIIMTAVCAAAVSAVSYIMQIR